MIDSLSEADCPANLPVTAWLEILELQVPEREPLALNPVFVWVPDEALPYSQSPVLEPPAAVSNPEYALSPFWESAFYFPREGNNRTFLPLKPSDSAE